MWQGLARAWLGLFVCGLFVRGVAWRGLARAWLGLFMRGLFVRGVVWCGVAWRGLLEWCIYWVSCCVLGVQPPFPFLPHKATAPAELNFT